MVSSSLAAILLATFGTTHDQRPVSLVIADLRQFMEVHGTHIEHWKQGGVSSDANFKAKFDQIDQLGCVFTETSFLTQEAWKYSVVWRDIDFISVIVIDQAPARSMSVRLGRDTLSASDDDNLSRASQAILVNPPSPPWCQISITFKRTQTSWHSSQVGPAVQEVKTQIPQLGFQVDSLKSAEHVRELMEQVATSSGAILRSRSQLPVRISITG